MSQQHRNELFSEAVGGRPRDQSLALQDGERFANGVAGEEFSSKRQSPRRCRYCATRQRAELRSR